MSGTNTTLSPSGDDAVQEAKIGTDDLRQWRVGTFEELRFTQKEAARLADATISSSVKSRMGQIRHYRAPLHSSRVKKMLDAGVTHKQVVNLLCDDDE